MHTQAKADVYEQITAAIVEAIEAGAGKYEMPWHHVGAPINAFTRKLYRGINILALWATTAKYGYTSTEWATYRQWSEAGAQVRRGQKSSVVVFWKFYDGKENDEYDEDEPEQRDTIRCFARAYHVFNANQVDGYQTNLQAAPELNEEQRIQTAEAFFAALPGEVEFGGNVAAYSPTLDLIRMPAFSQFKSPEAYVSVYAHERTHWTGAKQRLNRDLSGRFGTEHYAIEELVAELGSAYVCAALGIKSEPRKDHAPYLSNWLTVLRNDKRAIFTAASTAQEAVEYLQQLADVAKQKAS